MRLVGNPPGWRIINPIKVKYRGINFRSTLEGDWAATLDALGIEWRYEPQGLRLRSGVFYRPDFYLPAIGTWLEVKGPGVPGAEKAFELADSVRCSCFGADIAEDVRTPGAATALRFLELCECEWPDGEIVLIGLSPVPGRDGRTHGGGYASWIHTRGSELGLAACTNCGTHWWAAVNADTESAACRRCGALNDATLVDLALSGELPFARLKTGWLGRRRST